MNAPTTKDYVVIFNSGGPKPNSCASKGWEYAFTELFPQFGFTMIHLFAHFMRPMQVNQIPWLQLNFPSHPILDLKAFSRFGRNADYWWSLYWGGLDTLPKLEGESDAKYRSRATDIFRFAIDARPSVLFFDAMSELLPHQALFVERLETTYGIQVGYEPAVYEDATEMHHAPIAIQTEWWWSRENPKSASRWNTGKNKARPFRHVNEHPEVYRLIAGKDPIAEFQEARKSGHIPCVVKNHMVEGLK